jgi:formiminotetrahydrofolate cyclodeaminase
MPDETYRDLTLGAFTTRLASAEPVPGGGSASAVAASLAGSLLAMVAGLSMNRPKYAAYERTVERAQAAGIRARTRLLELADEDAAAYQAFGAAMKLPRDTEAEQSARRGAIGTAALAASEVPMEMVRECQDLIYEVEALAGRSNLNAASDLNVAALLADAAAHGAGANVLINLPMIGDDRVTGAMTAELTGYLREISDSASRVRQTVGRGELLDPEPE